MSDQTIRQGVAVRQFVTATRATRKLSSNAKHVILELLERDGANGAPEGQVWTTQPELAAACGLSTITAGRMVDELTAAGLFQSVQRVYPRQLLPNGDRCEHGCTVFTLAYEQIAALGPQVPTQVLGPATSRGLDDLRAEFETKLLAMESRLTDAVASRRGRKGGGGSGAPPSSDAGGSAGSSGSGPSGALMKSDEGPVRRIAFTDGISAPIIALFPRRRVAA